MKRVVVIVVMVLMLYLSAVAAEAMGLQGYTSKLWSAQDGLPDQNIQAFAQTPDGRLWIGTRSGLLSFDGASFTVYGRNVAPTVLGLGVNCLLAARDGSLWIGTEGGGLLHYQNHHFSSYAVPGKPADEFIRTIFQDGAGEIWVGADQGLLRVTGKSLTRVDGVGGIPDIFVRAIAEDRDGNLWVGGNKLLEFSHNSYVREIPLPSGIGQNLVYSLLVAHDGTLWAGALSGLYQLTPQNRLRRFHGFSAPVTVITQNSDGVLWVGTTGQGISLIRHGDMQHVSYKSLPIRTVTAVLEDREKDVWIGTRAGIIRLTSTPVNIIPIPGGMESNFETLYRDSDGSIWTTASSHLFHVRKGRAKAWQLPNLPGLRVRTVLRDRQGNFWIGTQGQGLLRISKSGIIRYTILNGLINDFVRVILQSRDGSIWVGTDGGLTHITQAGIRSFDTQSGLAYFDVTALLEARNGDIWVGTSRGLSHISGNRYIHGAATQALSEEQVWSIHQDASGEIWLGTSSGLYGFNGGKLVHLTTSQGLATNTVYDILEDHHGNVWLSGPNSVSRLRVSDLDAFAHGGIDRVHLTFFLDSHDLGSASLYGGLQPEGAIAPNGDVWFPASSGAVHIEVSRIRSESPFPLLINKIVANGQTLPPGHKVVLPPGNRHLEITYGVLRLGLQEAIRYRYRMEGLESWNDVSTRSTAYYTHLPSGRYEFQVEAFAIGNPGAVAKTSVEIVQRPYFYRTFWFTACWVSMLLGLIFLAYRLRLRRMRMRFQAVAEERARLAREMHDTVIQDCVGISTVLEAALGVEEMEEPLRRRLLNYANEQAKATIESAREAVWALRSTATTPASVASLCAELARKFESDSGILVKYSVFGTPFVFGDAVTHEVVMTVREGLSNAVRHASARCITLAIIFGESEMTITIQDDGVGFNLDAVVASGGHYGLIGMCERMNLLGARLSINSHSGQGTGISIVVPRKPLDRERRITHASSKSSR